MVGAAGDVADQNRLVEDRRDEGDVGEVGTAEGGVVGDRDVAGAEGDGVGDSTDAGAKRAEVDGDVRGVGDESALGIEEAAGEIEAFLDVGGEGDAAEHLAHLFDEAAEPCGEEFEFDGVVGRDGGAMVRLGSEESQRAVGQALRRPAGFDDGGGVVIADQGWAGHFGSVPRIGNGTSGDGVGLLDGHLHA